MPLYPPEFFLEIPDERDPYEEIEEGAEVLSIDAARIRKFVKRLPRRERAVMRLRYGFDGREYNIDEVASKLRISVGSVCNAERDAMQRLGAMYGLDDIDGMDGIDTADGVDVLAPPTPIRGAQMDADVAEFREAA